MEPGVKGMHLCQVLQDATGSQALWLFDPPWQHFQSLWVATERPLKAKDSSHVATSSCLHLILLILLYLKSNKSNLSTLAPQSCSWWPGRFKGAVSRLSVSRLAKSNSHSPHRCARERDEDLSESDVSYLFWARSRVRLGMGWVDRRDVSVGLAAKCRSLGAWNQTRQSLTLPGWVVMHLIAVREHPQWWFVGPVSKGTSWRATCKRNLDRSDRSTEAQWAVFFG